MCDNAVSINEEQTEYYINSRSMFSSFYVNNEKRMRLKHFS